jgi:hypothetical protein
MSQNLTSIEDFLKEQDNPQEQENHHLLATVEAIEGKGDTVKVTPWTRAAGCLCHLAINIKKASLEGVVVTGDTHVCCGKNIKVVELHFNQGETIGLSDLFQQMEAKAKTREHIDNHNHPLQPPYSHPSQFYQPQLFTAETDARPIINDKLCMRNYKMCLSERPAIYDSRAWNCECRNLYRICSHQGVLEWCPDPRY